MAVYTEVSFEELERFLLSYDVGRCIAFSGIQQGVENSNYLVETKRDRYILTLYERRVDPADLPFFLGLMRHLSANRIPCPLPVPGNDGEILRELNGRPATIVTFLEGASPKRPTTDQCRLLGSALADMHLAAASFKGRRANGLSVQAWNSLWRQCEEHRGSITDSHRREIAAEVDDVIANWPKALPQGIIHADLFPDNVFFQGDNLTGIIDFYFACSDFVAYDLAICMNAWCFESRAEFNITKARAFTHAYHAKRPLSPDEMEALPILNRGACLRFLLTRLFDWVHQVEGALVKPKDPREYLEKLRFHRDVRSPAAYGFD